MSPLVSKLKNEHALLVQTLADVQKLGIGTAEGKAKLMAAKTALLAHLNLEDSQLYPTLRRAAEADGALKTTLDIFARDMDGISKAALGFFDKYANGGSGTEFGKDYGLLHAALAQRIRKEENTLYPEYDRISA